MSLLRQLWSALRFRRGTPDPERFYADLAQARFGKGYTQENRFADFRAVFLGHSAPEQGQRVLRQILEWARLYSPVIDPANAHMTYYRDGERNMGLRILRTLHAEPRDKPEAIHKKETKIGG